MAITRPIAILLLLTLPLCLYAQSFNSGKNRKTFKGLKDRYPHHGVGIKVGDPIAASYRFYITEKYSIGGEFGRAASSLYNRYYTNAFDEYVDSDTFMTSDASVSFLSHRVRRDLMGEVKFVYHFGKVSSGLRFFLGVGWQFKSTRITYSYLYNNGTIENAPGTFERRRLTMGPVIAGGVEYSYKDIPIKAFMDIEYYSDVQIDPGLHRFQGGVGLRYIF
jgi:hypothetical protein